MAQAALEGTPAVTFARSLAVWAFALVFWAIAIPVHLLTFRDATIFRLMAHAWARISLALLGIRLVYENPSTLLDRRPRVVIVNHQSGLDLIWGAAISAPAPLAIGKRELIYIPVINVIWWGLGFIRIDRRHTAKAIESLRGVGGLIFRKRKSLFIAPEGTRTRDGRVGPFKKGAFHIAASHAIPIYPVVVDGAFELLPRGQFTFQPGVVRICFLPPVSTEGWSALKHDEFAQKVEQVRESMLKVLAEMRGRAAV